LTNIIYRIESVDFSLNVYQFNRCAVIKFYDKISFACSKIITFEMNEYNIMKNTTTSMHDQLTNS